jgi:Ser/Thr protein kinase RdoA (MazF antagonist)
MGGRNFDAEADEDWLRLGSLLGRLHAVGGIRPAPNRAVCGPSSLTRPLLRGLLDQGIVHGDLASAYEDLCEATLTRIEPRFAGLSLGRIHGDCHRGNILDRPSEGLYVIDFDDMMTGPAVQDLWLLLPDHADKCRRELALLVEGYERFLPFDPRELGLIESLRFMRMVYFLAWRAGQRDDAWFKKSFPDWGSKAFWQDELDDLRDQAELALGEVEQADSSVDPMDESDLSFSLLP